MDLENMTKVAIDCMGGDYITQHEEDTPPYKRAVEAALDLLVHNSNLYLCMVGSEKIIKELAEKQPSYKNVKERFRFLDAPKTVGMDGKNKESDCTSIYKAIMLAKDEGFGVFSAGNTASTVYWSQMLLRNIKGIKRAGLSTIIPTYKGQALLLDVGANPDCKPEHILQFAIMGSIYAEKVLNVQNPKVALLSNGAEEGKGNKVSNEAFKKITEFVSDNLKPGQFKLNFCGNVEPKSLIENGEIDVAVQDGFVLNISLKFGETIGAGLAYKFDKNMTKEFDFETISQIRAIISRIKREVDPSEYGGAPLLGVNGVVVVGHGESSTHAFYRGVEKVMMCTKLDLTGLITKEIEKLNL
jgi:glycerol-3-phosphate acyltransferase PlsX